MLNNGGELEVLVTCYNVPLFLPKGAKLAQGFTIPIDCLTSGKEPQVLWAEVLGSNRPTMNCELSQGDQPVFMSGMVDTGADITVISRRERPQTRKLESAARNIAGVGGNITLKSAQNITIKGSDGQLASVRPLVIDAGFTLWGRDTLSQWGTRIHVPRGKNF